MENKKSKNTSVNALKVENIGQENIRFYVGKVSVDQYGRALGGVFTVCVIRQLKPILYSQMFNGTLSSVPKVVYIYHRGISYCTPEDQYVKKTGRDIALGNAIRAMELTKAYHEQETKYKIPKYIQKLAESVLTFPVTHFSQYNVDLLTVEKQICGFRE